MVTTVASLGRSGLADWLIQRASAVVLAAYTIFITGFIATQPTMDFVAWSNLFDQLWMRIFTFLALLSVAAHGWIGLWGVLTDYVTQRMMGCKALPLRMGILGTYLVVTLAYLVWGFEILWGF
jgi:succinate dehydrogenase / fumarate reductase, membrane anchor subunit